MNSELKDIIELIKYYLHEFENAEVDAKNENMSVDEVTENLRIALIEDLKK